MAARRTAMEVVYVPDTDVGLRLAAGWLREKRPSGRDVVVVVPIKDSLENSPLLQRIASPYRVLTIRTLGGGLAFGRAVVLAVWLREDKLGEIAASRPKAVCVVQSLPEHTEAWLAAHSARDLTGRARTVAPPAIADPIVRVALEEVAGSVNLGTDLIQRSDHELAILVLRLLRDRERRVDPEEIYVWALATGWPQRGAAELRKLAREVLGGRRHRIVERQPFGDDVYRAWERKASDG